VAAAIASMQLIDRSLQEESQGFSLEKAETHLLCHNKTLIIFLARYTKAVFPAFIYS
jgi:hypothetical protein